MTKQHLLRHLRQDSNDDDDEKKNQQQPQRNSSTLQSTVTQSTVKSKSQPNVNTSNSSSTKSSKSQMTTTKQNNSAKRPQLTNTNSLSVLGQQKYMKQRELSDLKAKRLKRIQMKRNLFLLTQKTKRREYIEKNITNLLSGKLTNKKPPKPQCSDDDEDFDDID